MASWFSRMSSAKPSRTPVTANTDFSMAGPAEFSTLTDAPSTGWLTNIWGREIGHGWHCGCSQAGMNKTWLHVIVVNLLLVGILARLRTVLHNHIPLGYQDENGFHFGVPNSRED